MSETRRLCFVIMPFLPELHYFYLFLKQHVEAKHALRCERGDTRVMTVPLLDKVNAMIQEADVLIADCTGRNANVFYELGIAHAHNKRVILLTKDTESDAPIDVRHFEFIRYELDNHVAFLERLDNALHHLLFETYEPLYQRAVEVFDQFARETRAQAEVASKELFLSRVHTAEQARSLSAFPQQSGLAELLLPKIIADSTDAGLMSEVVSWLARQRAGHQIEPAD